VTAVLIVTVRAAEMLNRRLTASPAAVPGTAAGVQLPTVDQVPELLTFHEPPAAWTVGEVIRAIAEAARSRDKRVGFMGRIEFGFLGCEWVLLRESDPPYDLGQHVCRRPARRLAGSKKGRVGFLETVANAGKNDGTPWAWAGSGYFGFPEIL